MRSLPPVVESKNPLRQQARPPRGYVSYARARVVGLQNGLLHEHFTRTAALQERRRDRLTENTSTPMKPTTTQLAGNMINPRLISILVI